jgi:TolB-like protein/tetratricopeptide (TPR) repeat protein
MGDVSPAPRDASPVIAADDRLDSWKEIAAYLKRDVSTVQRWEKKEGLPVHRLPHDKLGSVFAFKPELDAWWGRGRHSIGAVQAQGIRRGSRRWTIWTGAAVTAAALVTGGFWWLRVGPHRPIQSLAVLPLTNLTGDPQQDYFAEGLTEALAAELSQIRDLSVVSGRSATRFRNGQRSAIEIAKALKVDALIDGAVVRSGSRVRVTVHLVDGRTDRRVWTSNFDRDLGDILVLFADVGRAVADATRVTISATDDRRRASPTAVNPKAYEAYLRGLYFRKRWQVGGCIQADQYFLEAIALDQNFAPPYAGRAFCHAFPDRLGLPGSQIHPLARAAAERALELDPNLAAGHYAVAVIKWRLEYDWVGAERSARQALALDPGSSDTHVLMGEYLYLTGRIDESARIMQRALDLEPFHMDHNVAAGLGLFHSRRYDQAILQFRRTLELDPNWRSARFWLAETYAAMHDEGAAVTEYLEWLRQELLPDQMAPSIALLRDAYRLSGWRAFWTRELELHERGSVWANQFPNPYFMARRYARLGDRERAINALEAAYTQRHHLMVFLKIERLFDVLRSDPRFQDLVRRVNIP